MPDGTSSSGSSPGLTTVVSEEGDPTPLLSAASRTGESFSPDQGGIVAMMLARNGDGVDAEDGDSYSPLMWATLGNEVDAMDVLLQAGANVDHQAQKGHTAMMLAAEGGHLDALRLLCRAKANPLLSVECVPSNVPALVYQSSHVPLDVAAHNGYIEIVHELVKVFGIEGCGGPSGGLLALVFASKGGHVKCTSALLDAGVVDDGEALCATIKFGREECVKLLLERRARDIETYVRKKIMNSAIPPACCFHPNSLRPFSCRIMRRLLDARADTTGCVMRRVGDEQIVFRNFSEYAVFLTYKIKGTGVDGDNMKLLGVQGLHRLLMQEEAVHATSWLWAKHVTATTSTRMDKSPPIVRMLPLLRRRATKPGVLQGSLTRYYSKLDVVPGTTRRAKMERSKQTSCMGAERMLSKSVCAVKSWCV